MTIVTCYQKIEEYDLTQHSQMALFCDSDDHLKTSLQKITPLRNSHNLFFMTSFAISLTFHCPKVSTHKQLHFRSIISNREINK